MKAAIAGVVSVKIREAIGIALPLYDNTFRNDRCSSMAVLSRVRSASPVNGSQLRSVVISDSCSTLAYPARETEKVQIASSRTSPASAMRHTSSSVANRLVSLRYRSSSRNQGCPGWCRTCNLNP